MRKSVLWYFKRLRKMPLLEIGSRVLELMYYKSDCFRFKNGWISHKSTSLNLNVVHDYAVIELEEGKNIIDRGVSVEEIDNSNWFKSNRIPTNFDLRLYWEGHRFKEYIVLAREENGEELLKSSLKSWMNHNKPLKGLNYISTMECAIRCINLFSSLVILKRAKGDISQELIDISNSFFITNYDLIRHRLSLFSSRGNHTLFEYAGLVIICHALSKSELSFWQGKLESEFDYQTFNDGSGIEQSTAYHLFNIELCLLVHSVISSDSILYTLKRAAPFISNFISSDSIVRFGDSDSSYFFDWNSTLRLLSTFDTDHKEYIKNYSDSGLAIIRNNIGTCYFKYGCFGMPPLFGHAHYDFLSVVFKDMNNSLVSADSQTYTYTSFERASYRSSKYHSMPSFGEDDIKQLTPFSWSRGGSGKLLATSDSLIKASYSKEDGTKLTRSVHFGDDYFMIVDEVDFDGSNVTVGDFKLCVRWLLLSNVFDMSFFEVDAHEKISNIDPLTEKLDYSKLYGRKENDILTCLSFEISKSSRLVSVFKARDCSSNYLDYLDCLINSASRK